MNIVWLSGAATLQCGLSGYYRGRGGNSGQKGFQLSGALRSGLNSTRSNRSRRPQRVLHVQGGLMHKIREASTAVGLDLADVG